MHPYATNSPASPKLLAVLGIAAAVIAPFLSHLSNQIYTASGIFVGGVSALAVFGLLYFVFDRYLWRWRWVRALLLVPDLNGRWHCEGRTISKSGTAVDYAWSGTVVIRQSWSRLVVVLRTTRGGAGDERDPLKSSSRSIAASVYHEPGTGFQVIYHYDNTPSAAEPELQRHSGLCRLVFNESADRATGDYFTDRDRMTVGTMQLRREGPPNDAPPTA